MTVACVLVPRFELTVAAGGSQALVQGPLALAPGPGGQQLIGQPSAAAEGCGVRAGMRLGEALTRCPQLRLVAPDPVGTATAWEEILVMLESIGAAVESPRAGEAYFDAGRLLRLHDGVEGVAAAARRTLRRPLRMGIAPSRFCALVAAMRTRPRRTRIVAQRAARAFLAPQPVALLRSVAEVEELVESLERLGVRTLGEVALLSRAALADRFGNAGLRALQLALGEDCRLRPRRPGERLRESLDLPEAASGPQLEQALGLLIDRLLARAERRGRTLRTAILAATLVEGGSWQDRVCFRESMADPLRMRLALAPRLGLLPAPANALSLEAHGLGPPAFDRRSLIDEPATIRDARLREAVRQARASAGPDAALRVLVVDSDSRVPERRAMLAPFAP